VLAFNILQPRRRNRFRPKALDNSDRLGRCPTLLVRGCRFPLTLNERPKTDAAQQGRNPMKLSRFAAALFAAGTIVASQAQAQAPDLNIIPDKMPFNIPYGAPISAERARHVLDEALAEARRHGWEMNIAVVDPHGDLKAFVRMDDAQLASISIAEHKARTAARYRRETRLFEDAVMKGVAYIPTLDDVIASRGGIPLVEDGRLIGAVGCSGGTGSQDEAVCKFAAEVVNRR
jgi:glc operon protein GlcG